MMKHRHHLNNISEFFGRPVWRNSTRTLRVHPLKYYQPTTLEELKEIVSEGIASRLLLRAVGSGHSYSKAPEATEILIDTDRLSRILGAYRYTSTEGIYYEVESGTKVRTLNEKLDQLNYCIPAMGGIDHQSLAGAISTGTHGSSLNFGAMSSMVCSIVLVTHDLLDPEKVKTYRIEPTSGISNPELYLQGHELIQNDEVFNSVLVGFGCFGIIYSYVLKLEKMFYLSEKRIVKSWTEVEKKLKNGLLKKATNVTVQINPYPHNGQQIALLTTHEREIEGKKNLLKEDTRHKIWDQLKRKTRAPLVELIGRIPYLFWITVYVLNKNPKSVCKQIHRAINAQKDEEYYNKGYKVMYQGLDYIKERGYDCEFAVPIKNNEYLDVLKELFTELAHLSTKYNIHLTSPVGLRFVKSSKAFLTPESEADVCYIDTPVLLHVYGSEAILEKMQKFMKQHKARPHWGKKNNCLDVEYIKSIYPKYENWKVQEARFNKLKLFSNAFSRQMVSN